MEKKKRTTVGGGNRKRKAQSQLGRKKAKTRRVSFAEIPHVKEFDSEDPVPLPKKPKPKSTPMPSRSSLKPVRRASAPTIPPNPKPPTNRNLIEQTISEKPSGQDMRFTSILDAEIRETTTTSRLSRPQTNTNIITFSHDQDPQTAPKQRPSDTLGYLQNNKRGKSLRESDLNITFSYDGMIDYEDDESLTGSGDTRGSTMRFTDVIQDSGIEISTTNKSDDAESGLVTPQKTLTRQKSIFAKSPVLRKFYDDETPDKIQFVNPRRESNTHTVLNRITTKQFYKLVNMNFIDGMEVYNRRSEYDPEMVKLTPEEEVFERLVINEDIRTHDELIRNVMMEVESTQQRNEILEQKFDISNPPAFVTIQGLSDDYKNEFLRQTRRIKSKVTVIAKTKIRNMKNKMREKLIDIREQAIAFLDTTTQKLDQQEVELKENIQRLEKSLQNDQLKHTMELRNITQTRSSLQKCDIGAPAKYKIHEKFKFMKKILNCQLRFVDKDHFVLRYNEVGFEVDIKIRELSVIANYKTVKTPFFSTIRKLKDTLLKQAGIGKRVQKSSNFEILKETLLYIQIKENKIKTICDIIEKKLIIGKKCGHVMPVLDNEITEDSGIKIRLWFRDKLYASVNEFACSIFVTFRINTEYPRGCDFEKFEFRKVKGNVVKEDIEKIIKSESRTSYFKLERICEKITNLVKGQQK